MSLSHSLRPVVLRATQILLYAAVCGFFSFGQVVCAQAQNTQGNETTEYSKSTTELRVDNVSPSRTTETHATIGNRSIDNQQIERTGPDGHYQPYSDIETETVQVNPTTKRVVVRTYLWDADRRRNLVQLREEESHSSANGDSHLVRTTFNADANGNLQVAAREVGETKSTSPTTQEAQTTTYIGDGTGDFRPYLQTREVQSFGTDQSTEIKKTTLQPDGNGKWAIIETDETTTKQEGKTRIIDNRLFRADANGKLSESSRTVSEEIENAIGEQAKRVEMYSANVPGGSGDGNLHLVHRETSVQADNSSEQKTEQLPEEADPGNPSDGLRVTSKTTEVVQSGPLGKQRTKTFQVRNGHGTFDVVGVETQKIELAPATQSKPQTPSSSPPKP
jgi:hypothetical protein